MTALLCVPLVFALGAWPPGGFSLFAEKNGVRVYRGSDKSVIELAAEGEFLAPPAQVRRVLIDYGNHGRWVKEVRETRVLTSGDGFLDVYQRLDLPILDDRDFTLHVTWGAEGDTLWLRFTTQNDRGPGPRSGVVRLTVHEGEWRFEPIDGGRATRAHYRVRLDLAGSLPAWMGRGSAARDLPAMFEGVRSQLPNYR